MFNELELQRLKSLYERVSIFQPWTDKKHVAKWVLSKTLSKTLRLEDFLEPEEINAIKERSNQYLNLGNRLFVPKKASRAIDQVSNWLIIDK